MIRAEEFSRSNRNVLRSFTITNNVNFVEPVREGSTRVEPVRFDFANQRNTVFTVLRELLALGPLFLVGDRGDRFINGVYTRTRREHGTGTDLCTQ